MDRRPLEAKAFYGAVALATALGAALNVSSLDPIKALYWSAVVNGVVAVPIMAVMLLMAARREIMGEAAVAGPLRLFGWAATIVMAAAAAAMLVTFGQ